MNISEGAMDISDHDISEGAQRNPSQSFYACFNFKILVVRRLVEKNQRVGDKNYL